MKMHYYLTALIASSLSLPLLADDTEIYLGTADRVNPNVIFIFDTSGSMAFDAGGESRMSITQRAAIDTLNDISGINIALMRYNPKRLYVETGVDKEYRGGSFNTPMLNIDAGNNRQIIRDIINAYPADGGTPLTESVHEAYNFFLGNPVNYGREFERGECINWQGPWWNQQCSEYSYIIGYSSHSETHNNGTYISPIVDECQKNHIVLFTDGDSSVDGESNEAIRSMLSALPGFTSNELIQKGLSTTCESNPGGNKAITDSCLEELAFVMNNRDARSDLPGRQNVQFHTVGGFISGNSQVFLDNAALHGGGISANAQNYDELRRALTKIFDDIVQSAGTFSAPAVAVNAFNSLEQLDQLYYSVFKPSDNVGWSGNVKRFRLSSDGIIVDSKGNPAVDPATGFFSTNAQSYWTLNDDAPDGDNVERGGMASRLTTNRNVYTNITSNDLAVEKNRVHETTPDLKTHFNTSLTGENFVKLVKWARGVLVDSNGNDIPRRSMEDPLHSRPVLLNYGRITIDGKDVPDSTLFIGTNSGYLHAFDTHEKQPRERFAFIPKELLPVVAQYYERSGTKQYGLDGPISVWHDDKNRNQIIDNREQAILYIGMRRGGSSYYALDVSNRDQPRLLWQIDGRNPLAGNSTTSGFERLGQTWSRMIPATINWTDGKDRKVLFFGGGYDPKEDDYLVRTNHEQGNAIFMVDATTGQLLWRATDKNSPANFRHDNMTSSFASDLVVVDDNGDGLANIIYAADLGGRIWRLDINHTAKTANDFVNGGVIADLGADGSRANNVRFYNKPDVIYTEYGTIWDVDDKGNKREVGKRGRYQIAIGSGFRAHPLNNEAIDHFYVINDYNTNGAPESYNTLRKSDLADFDRYNLESMDKKMNGLFYKLPNVGEKVLSNSVTIRDTIYFSTYRPNDKTTRSGCDADTGIARTYTIKPVTDPNDLERVIDSKTLRQSGIVSEPVLVRTNPDPDNPDSKREEGILIGAELVIIEDSEPPVKRTYWREQEL
ncbi:MAG: hypothetical protein IBX52_04100 [Bacterioplanes sp.]|nr:hypothetical protein [Bacterioplanes sp.]